MCSKYSHSNPTSMLIKCFGIFTVVEGCRRIVYLKYGENWGGDIVYLKITYILLEYTNQYKCEFEVVDTPPIGAKFSYDKKPFGAALYFTPKDVREGFGVSPGYSLCIFRTIVAEFGIDREDVINFPVMWIDPELIKLAIKREQAWMDMMKNQRRYMPQINRLEEFYSHLNKLLTPQTKYDKLTKQLVGN